MMKRFAGMAARHNRQVAGNVAVLEFMQQGASNHGHLSARLATLMDSVGLASFL